MSTVDGILASGIYRDRHGRYWEACKVTSCSEPGEWWNYHDMARNGGRHLTVTQMRLLIARDKHRVECKGLLGCRTHPVPVVTIQYNEDGLIIYETDYTRRTYPTLPEAMDAARALAVEP